MKRRDLLRAAGAATALSLLPRDAEAAWSRVMAGYRPAAGLTSAQRSLVGGIADVIFPRTDTPSATDVGVTDWVDLIVAEYYADDVRTVFASGLDSIDAQVRGSQGRAFAELDLTAKVEVVASLDAPRPNPSDGREAPAAQDDAARAASAARAAYTRLKGLVVHGYFTSQRVEREVLRVRTSYPKFDGAADHRPGGAR